MKSVLFVLYTLFLVGCNTTTQQTNPNAAIEGTWELIGFYNYQNNKVVDSFVPIKGYKQVKMYSKSKVMWSKNVPGDSTDWFGYGIYEISGDTLIEVLDYGSQMMKKIIDQKEKFVYELFIDKNNFTQIEIDPEGNRIYAENYKRIE